MYTVDFTTRVWNNSYSNAERAALYLTTEKIIDFFLILLRFGVKNRCQLTFN